MTEYLTTADALFFHNYLIERYGGAAGIRDVGALESALHRPQTGYYADLIEEAGALWESLAQNHPFTDGNKRIAFAATYAFLAINGFEIRARADGTFAFIDDLHRRGAFRFEELVRWLRAHTEPR